jgi:uncharacterized membrane protein YhaH (DUF805 family)
MEARMKDVGDAWGDFGDLLFEFDERINRAEFWLGTAVVWGVFFVGGLVAIFVAVIADEILGALLVLLLFASVTWMSLAVSVKRWHDRDKSGWWVFIALIPIVGLLWAIIETGFLKGVSGRNEYGPDPLA